jgi:hypothetical protein
MNINRLSNVSRRRFISASVSTTSVDVTEIGTLVIDIFDSKSNQLIWRGMSSDALSSKPEKDAKKLSKEVSDMFKNFPPKSKG